VLHSFSTDAAAQLTRAKNELETAHRSLMGALLFSCGGRGPHAFGGVDMMDAHAFQNVSGLSVFPFFVFSLSFLTALVFRCPSLSFSFFKLTQVRPLN
jgi:hypothetical protein